jgi:hypothetical protein
VRAVRFVDHGMCRIPDMDAARLWDGKLTSITKIQIWGMTVHGLFILHCSNYLVEVTLYG